MPSRLITNHELSDLFNHFEHSVFRCELRSAYLVPEETRSVTMFLEGVVHDPLTIPYFRDGFAAFRQITASGRTMRRVRVHDTPLTDYQRWLRWLSHWNADAGEQITSLDRNDAIDAGLVRADETADDFWLFDDRTVVTMRFAADNSLSVLTSSDSPETVAAAIEWREQALEVAPAIEATPT